MSGASEKLENIEPRPDRSRPRLTQPLNLLLVLALSVTIGFLCHALWRLPAAYRGYTSAQENTIRTLDLIEKAFLYDEVLTMSARMGAVTGDNHWVERSARNEPLLTSVLSAAETLFPGPEIRAAESANAKLVGLEHRANGLVRSHDKRAAEAVFGPEYEEQKSLYNQSMTAFDEAVRQTAEENVREARSGLKQICVVLASLSGIVVLAWLGMIRQTVKWNDTLQRQNRELSQQAEALLTSNLLLRELQASLLQSQKLELIGTLTSGVAHNFNNQLMPIIGHIDLIKGNSLSETEKQSSIEAVLAAAQNCQELVQSLMSLSRPATPIEGQVNPIPLLKELQVFLRKTLPSSMVLRFHLPPELPKLRGNAAELQPVFLNLAMNARDAMPGGGKLLVSAVDAGPKGVEFTVEDDGPGMSAETVARIFEPFFTTKAPGLGTGLGLSTTVRVVESHGGSIEVFSSPGKGTRFVLCFPSDTRADVISTVSEARPDGVTDKGIKVLVVDDDEAIRNLLRRALQTQGIEALIAANGVEALAMYNKREFQAVVSDVTMPEMGGLELLKNLLLADPDAVVILLSGMDVAAEHADGVAAIVTKPYKIKELAALIRRLVVKPS